MRARKEVHCSLACLALEKEAPKPQCMYFFHLFSLKLVTREKNLLCGLES